MWNSETIFETDRFHSFGNRRRIEISQFNEKRLYSTHFGAPGRRYGVQRGGGKQWV